ncbi:hypothetical protein GY45DRAFT_360754 [Cubamyces sp. BRFM 1775]|nr:hypothetical protein GY45DRAFT_360754 [Cubamyces sp. BRFM 1775]
MASTSDDICAGCCAGCCIACTEALEQWCTLKSYGSGGSNKQAGCCTKCCGKSFDEDDFATAHSGAGGNAQNGDAVASQPPPQKPMTEKPADS